ncbi:hypothetical protein TNCV_3036581 [Trichonephila clavipes]|nr:hypothetical protein TNCV_3036581 [Trichonephila clavipes]
MKSINAEDRNQPQDEYSDQSHSATNHDGGHVYKLQSSRWCSCLDGAVRLARTIDLEGYTGGSLLLVGSPKPGRLKGKCQTKRNTTTSQDRLLPSWCSDLYDQQKLLTTSSNDVVDTEL